MSWNSCCIRKSIMDHQQNWSSPYLVKVIGSVQELILQMNNLDSLIVLIVKYSWVVNKIWWHSIISFKRVSLWCPLSILGSTPIQTPFNYRCPLKKSNQITPSCGDESIAQWPPVWCMLGCGWCHVVLLLAIQLPYIKVCVCVCLVRGLPTPQTNMAIG